MSWPTTPIFRSNIKSLDVSRSVERVIVSKDTDLSNCGGGKSIIGIDFDMRCD